MKIGLVPLIILITGVILVVSFLIMDIYETFRDHSDDPNYISDVEYRHMHADDPEEHDDDIYYW